MALIICPQCGKSISDKAFKCPHCNESIITHVSATNANGDSRDYAETVSCKDSSRILKSVFAICIAICGILAITFLFSHPTCGSAPFDEPFIFETYMTICVGFIGALICFGLSANGLWKILRSKRTSWKYWLLSVIFAFGVSFGTFMLVVLNWDALNYQKRALHQDNSDAITEATNNSDAITEATRNADTNDVITEQIVEESDNSVNIFGTYEFSDGIHIWELVLNEDETCTVRDKSVDGVIIYGSWAHWTYSEKEKRRYSLKFTDMSPTIWFNGDEYPSELRYPVFDIVDSYIYANENACDSKNPRKRFSITKVK